MSFLVKILSFGRKTLFLQGFIFLPNPKDSAQIFGQNWTETFFWSPTIWHKIFTSLYIGHFHFRFRSYLGMGAPGFSIMYEAKNCANGSDDVLCSSSCSRSYHDLIGTVSIHGLPRRSEGAINCAYSIMQQQGSYIQIKGINTSIPCGTSFLEIRDGPNDDSPLMGRFCDGKTHMPINFQSSHHHVVLRFVKSSFLLVVKWAVYGLRSC